MVSIPLWFDQNSADGYGLSETIVLVSIPLWFDQNCTFDVNYFNDDAVSFNSTMVRLEPPSHYLRVPYYNKPLPTLQPLFLGKLEITSFFLQIHSKLQKIPRSSAPCYDWFFSHFHPFFILLKREKQPVFLRSTENHCQR